MWHDPENRLQKAIDRYEEGDVEACRAMLRGLERLGVIHARIDLYLGHCHMEDDRPQAALRRYRRAAALSATEVSAWVGIALCHGRLGHLERALEVLRHAARLDPEREDVHCHLVHCYALLGSLGHAEAHARLAMDLDPACPHVHRHLALAYFVAGQARESLAAWQGVLERDPDHPEADVGRGRCYAALGRRAEAHRHYLAALGGPYAADAHAGLGDLSWMASRLEDAALHYRSALAREPDHEEARTRLVETLVELGRLDEAAEVLEPLREAWAAPADPRAVLREPGPADPDVVFLAARLLGERGCRAEAVRLLHRFVARYPASAAAWCRLGRYLLDARRLGLAVKVLRRALRREDASEADDEPGEAARYLARALGRRGRPREAVKVLARAAWRHPGRAELHLDLGAALLARGRPRSAERALLRALDVLPETAAIWAAVAELALERGQRALARRRLREALRHDPRHGTALALLVRWHLDRGDARRALHAARAASRVLPIDHPVAKDEARALLALGRSGEAAIPLRRYVLTVPSDPEGYRLLARVLEAAGDEHGARTQRRIGALVGAPSPSRA